MTLDQIEQRFCECTKLEMNLSTFPIKKEHYKEQKQETIKELSDKYGFVPTPIFLVDEMIGMEQDNLSKDSITCDFCAGCGQYTIRLLRFLYNKFQIDVEDFLKNNHYITELQAENCAALVYTFGTNINLYVGDSMNLKYSDENDKGILFFNEKNKKWENNSLIDKLLTKKDINTNREVLSYIFNNYKHSKKILDYIQNYDFESYKKKKEEEKQVEVITVEKVPEVIEQINEPIKENIKEQDKPKEEKVEVVKEDKPKKQAKPKKKGIGNNTKEEADDFFNMFGGFKPLKT